MAGPDDDNDDLAFFVADGPRDETSPTVSITSPPFGAERSGTVTLAADASDDTVISRVEFLDDRGVRIGTASRPPWSVEWNVASLPPGWAG